MVAWSALLALVLACRPQPQGDSDPSRDSAEPPEVVDVFDVPLQWAAAPGWGLREARVLGDIDGDGFVDASVISWPLGGAWSEWDLLIVRGPLRRRLTLPGDHAATLEGALYLTGNAYDNGGTDVLVASMYEVTLFDGPDLLALDPEGQGRVVAHGVGEVNGDGILDQVAETTTDGAWGVWFGPADRWSNPEPDLTLTFDCPDDAPLFLLGGLFTLPDVTGDGRREAFSEGWLYADPGGEPGRDPVCQGLMYPLPEGPGPVDVLAVPEVVWGFLGPRSWQVVDDQTGDGVPDLLADVDLYPAPVRFLDAGKVESTGRSTPWEIPPAWVSALPVDVTGDGKRDFLGGVDDVAWVFAGGPGEIGRAVHGVRVPAYRLPRAAQVWAEDGVASALVAWGNGVAVVELGPSRSAAVE